MYLCCYSVCSYEYTQSVQKLWLVLVAWMSTRDTVSDIGARGPLRASGVALLVGLWTAGTCGAAAIYNTAIAFSATTTDCSRRRGQARSRQVQEQP